MLNAQELQGQWNEVRGRLKERWGALTDDDLKIPAGDVDQLVGQIQRKTGESREAIENFLDAMTIRAETRATPDEIASRLRREEADAAFKRWKDVVVTAMACIAVVVAIAVSGWIVLTPGTTKYTGDEKKAAMTIMSALVTGAIGYYLGGAGKKGE